MSDAFPITIYHNPDCGTSRNALAMIEAAGYVPTVVDYREAGWTRGQLEHLFSAMVRNAEQPMTFFCLPINRVVELGSQVEI